MSPALPHPGRRHHEEALAPVLRPSAPFRAEAECGLGFAACDIVETYCVGRPYPARGPIHRLFLLFGGAGRGAWPPVRMTILVLDVLVYGSALRRRPAPLAFPVIMHASPGLLVAGNLA